MNDFYLHSFSPLNLEQLNAKAAMLERLDHKYVIRQEVLAAALPELSSHFDILEIAGKRSFHYETCYFDNAERDSYYYHHQGRRQRCKVRTRKYTDSGLCFVEIKLKDKRGMTIKKRLTYELENYGSLDARAYAFIQAAYAELYGQAFNLHLAPVLEMHYQRTTLIAKKGSERMTLDNQLIFSTQAALYPVDKRLLIIETKSETGHGLADKILRQLHQHPVAGCSKYCLGMAALKEISKYNKFLPALRKLNIPSASRNLEQYAA